MTRQFSPHIYNITKVNESPRITTVRLSVDKYNYVAFKVV